MLINHVVSYHPKSFLTDGHGATIIQLLNLPVKQMWITSYTETERKQQAQWHFSREFVGAGKTKMRGNCAWCENPSMFERKQIQ